MVTVKDLEKNVVEMNEPFFTVSVEVLSLWLVPI